MRRVEIGPAILYRADCRDVLPTLEKVDAVVTDPPYGIGFCHSGYDVKGIGGGKYRTKFGKVRILGDDEPFDPRPILGYGTSAVFWGGNHYADKLPPSPNWLIWDKRCASGHSNNFADCEIAWASWKRPARVFRHHWDGMIKASERGIPRVHPTQKPIALMAWCIDQLPDPNRIILDPFMGSGTTGVAAIQLGRRFIGIEKDPAYFKMACKRIAEAVKICSSSQSRRNDATTTRLIMAPSAKKPKAKAARTKSAAKRKAPAKRKAAPK
jgi:site-specific DNA-methyltransferase (adenine-specific)